MSPELPDLEPLRPVDEMMRRESASFTHILFGLALLVPWGIVYLAVTTGTRVWLAVLNLVAMYAGLAVRMYGQRNDRQRLATWGGAGAAGSLALCLVVQSVLQGT
ncbi:hypothetical protein [Streptomyces sp. NPDC048650]|uniref:hypothetical protein n=1 Tax=unclassified Streptomyces TaxID=2593676 RepID=UPI003723AF7D